LNQCIMREQSNLKENEVDTLNDDRMKWFQEATYGMFVHWGLYAVPAGEWNGETGYGEWIQQNANIPGDEYEKFPAKFVAENFSAEEWVRLAKDAGMKYLVITAKHHEGFCMFDTKYSDYNIVRATPFGRDPMKDLAHECHKANIKFCFYYSVKDWHHTEYPTMYTRRKKEHPDGFHAYPNPDADYHKYLDYLEGQVTELLTNYGPIGILWFDVSLNGPAEPENRGRAGKVIETIHRLQPDCLINNRFGGLGADYGTPEQHIPEGQLPNPFEVCMTLNDHWGYNKNDNNWKDVKTVIRNLVDIRSKGGNFLLNVGPTAEGSIPEPSAHILREAGQWLKVNGKSVYGAKPAGPLTSIRADKSIAAVTAGEGCYYLHIFTWPDDKKAFLINFMHKFRSAYLLADAARTPLKADVYRRSLMIHLPQDAPDSSDSVIVIEYD
jgi:alpha-L-fucosidase